MLIVGIILIILSIFLFVIAFFIYFRLNNLKNELNNEKIKIRDDFLEKERKIKNLEVLEQKVLLDTEKLKQEKMEEINALFVQETTKMQTDLTGMRLKQEIQIKKEIQEKRKEELAKLQETLEKEVADMTASHQEQIERIKGELESYRSLEDAARMARIREANENNEKTWHTLGLSKEDIEELKELDSIKLRNPLPLRKAIYEIYYREPTRAMINRVLENESFSGIYKITQVDTGEAYVGKSVDLKRRWTDHIRRGVGADNPTQMILYDAMKEYGVHAFTFEVVEKVDAAKLTERENYWIDYFGTKVFGYNMRGG